MMPEEKKMIHLNIVVSGKVQGVGFRFFAQRKAVQYGINGWVRNLDDGSVEIRAMGDKKQMDSFMRDLKRGNPFSAIDHMQVDELDGQGGLSSSFKIKY
jgi:acylphosphatase